MRRIKLSPRGPMVSALCMGTAGFGTKVSKDDAFSQMDLFFGKGGNFFDTARVYGAWAPEGCGTSEKVLGSWIQERKCRDKVLISTKGAHPDMKTMNIPRMSPEELRSDLEESLNALETDYIDLYFLHRDDVSRPAEEILKNLEMFRKEGKIRHYGCSNWTLERIEEAKIAAQKMSFEGFMCNQIRWGLGDVNLAAFPDKTTVAIDKNTWEYHQKTKMAVMAYTSSCHGYFSKKLKGQSSSPSTEAVYANASNQILLEKLKVWEKKFGHSAAVLVSAYVPSHDFPAVSVASFSSLQQVEEIAAAGDFILPPECLEDILAVKRFVI